MGDIDPCKASSRGGTAWTPQAPPLRGSLYLGGNPMGLPETATITPWASPSSLRAAWPHRPLDWFDIDYRNRILTPGNDVTVLQRPELAAHVNRSAHPGPARRRQGQPGLLRLQTESPNTIKFISSMAGARTPVPCARPAWTWRCAT